MVRKLAEIDYEHILEPQLLDFLKRVEDLEATSVMESSFIQMRELEWDSHTSEMRRSIRLMKAQLEDLKSAVKRNKELFIGMIGDFKCKANTEDFQKLSRMAGDMKMEEYMTRPELAKLNFNKSNIRI